jgi:hypothetical protein
LAGVFVAMVIGPRVFPKNWFEHSLAEFGESQGNVATGFVMVDMVDPARQTDVKRSIPSSCDNRTRHQLCLDAIAGSGHHGQCVVAHERMPWLRAFVSDAEA